MPLVGADENEIPTVMDINSSGWASQLPKSHAQLVADDLRSLSPGISAYLPPDRGSCESTRSRALKIRW